MSLGYEAAVFLLDFISTLRHGDDAWKEERARRLAELEKVKKISAVQAEFEIETKKIEFEHQTERHRVREEKRTERYKDFLESIELVRDDVLKNFKNMPPPMAHLLYHHMAEIVTDMWDKPENKRRALETKLSNIIEAIYDDQISGRNLPEKTMLLIKGEAQSNEG